MPFDVTPLVLLLILVGIGAEVGGILIFRTLTGLGPRPSKLLSFGASGMFLALSLFLAHMHLDILIVMGTLALAFLAQGYHVWLMCKRHYLEWQRRERARES